MRVNANTTLAKTSGLCAYPVLRLLRNQSFTLTCETLINDIVFAVSISRLLGERFAATDIHSGRATRRPGSTPPDNLSKQINRYRQAVQLEGQLSFL